MLLVVAARTRTRSAYDCPNQPRSVACRAALVALYNGLDITRTAGKNLRLITMTLEQLGWTAFFAAQVDNSALLPCRVVGQSTGLCLLNDGSREVFATIRGHLRNQTEVGPAVGDWVLANPADSERYVIEWVLDRRTVMARKRPGVSSSSQVLAANVDRVMLVTSMDRDFSIRRLERYLTLVWESGATPIIVLTKADLAEDSTVFRRQAESCALGFPVLCISSISGQGLDELRSLLQPGETIVLLGSSGVGKSTLINLLSGRALRRTVEVRESNGKGRHATSDRYLIPLESGALLIDTPGLREVQLWAGEDTVSQTFPEITELASQCRFRDCQHTIEPGCAVLAGVAEGLIEASRLESLLHLRRELRYLDRQGNVLLAVEEKRRIRQLMRAYQKRKRTQE